MDDFFNVDPSDAVEMSVVPDGEEAQLEITDVTVSREKCYIMLRMKVTDRPEEMIKDFNTFLHYPKPEDDQSKVNNKKLRVQSFYESFGITPPFENPEEEWKGLTGKAILRVEESSQYGKQNDVKSFV
jgi:hypothetical protein